MWCCITLWCNAFDFIHYDEKCVWCKKHRIMTILTILTVLTPNPDPAKKGFKNGVAGKSFGHFREKSRFFWSHSQAKKLENRIFSLWLWVQKPLELWYPLLSRWFWVTFWGLNPLAQTQPPQKQPKFLDP